VFEQLEKIPDTLRICEDLLEVIAYLENAIKETKHEEAKQALFIRSLRQKPSMSASKASRI
jgi:hypothetical protein